MRGPLPCASAASRLREALVDLHEVRPVVGTVSDLEPTTVLEIEQTVREMTSRLRELTVEHREQCVTLGKARAAYERKFLEAHLRSLIDHPKRKVDEHKTYARSECIDEYEALCVAEELEKAMRHEMHSIRQILVSQGTLGRFVADEAGHGIYGRDRR